MKRNKYLNLIATVLSIVVLVFVSACEGPMGPEGPVGPAGEKGADGTPGVAGNETCLECHTLDTKYLVTQQYEGSVHAQGEAVAFAGSRAGCARCHSEQGFIETQWSGLDVTANDFAFPSRISCTTCHSWHNESFDPAVSPDYALRSTNPVELLMFRAYDLPAQSLDLGDNSNLCVNCHQPRRSWEGYLTTDDNMGDTYNQGSTRFGPHHGPQSTSLAGIGGADVGTTPLPGTGHIHAVAATCTTCHMDSKDHGFEPTLAGCNTASCHNGSMETLTENTRQIAVRTKFEELETALVTAGLLAVDPDDGSIGQVAGVFPTEHVGALFNYEWVLDDRSDGVHNFTFIEALLDKSLEALQ